MSENNQAAAIAALFSIGILLLNFGFEMIQNGDLWNGLIVILFGIALILAAVLVTKLMMQNIGQKLVQAALPAPKKTTKKKEK